MGKNFLHDLHRLRMANYEVEDMCARYNDECGMPTKYLLTKEELEKIGNSQYELDKLINEKRQSIKGDTDES